MKTIIFGGFLGSGKTTILLEFAKYISENNLGKIAIIENEIGKVGIDDQYIKDNGYQATSLYAGCICCTMVTNLVQCVKDMISDESLDWILIETTGVAYPGKVNEILQSYADIKAKIVCVTDAQRWDKLKAVTAHLLNEQVESADILLINKIDTVSLEKTEQLKKEMQLINKEAQIYGISAKDKTNKYVYERFLK